MTAPTAPLVANWPGVQGSLFLLAILVLAAAGTTAVFALSLVAYYRRRRRSYALIALAIGLLVVRTAVGFGTLRGVTPMLYHHLIEHTFDFLISALVLAAAYFGGAGTDTGADSDAGADADPGVEDTKAEAEAEA